MPFVRDEIEIGLEVKLAEEAPKVPALVRILYLYPVITEPPVLLGAAKEREIEPLPATATALETTPGVVAGVPTADALDAAPDPTIFTARILMVYSTPFVKPVTVTGEAVPVAEPHVNPPLSEYSYAVIALPPFAPAVKEICNCASPTVAEVFTTGALGVVAVVIEELEADAALVPIPLTALTRKM